MRCSNNPKVSTCSFTTASSRCSTVWSVSEANEHEHAVSFAAQLKALGETPFEGKDVIHFTALWSRLTGGSVWCRSSFVLVDQQPPTRNLESVYILPYTRQVAYPVLSCPVLFLSCPILSSPVRPQLFFSCISPAYAYAYPNKPPPRETLQQPLESPMHRTRSVSVAI